MPLLGDKPSYGGPNTSGTGSRWQYNSPTRNPIGIVLHTSEQSSDAYPGDDAEQLCAFLATPGIRPSGSGTYGSGYHAVTDNSPVPGWWRTAPDQARTNSAPPTNGTHLHLCIPTRASSSRLEWITSPLRDHIRVAADFIVHYSALYSIPLRRVSPAELASSTHGYCDHATVTAAYHQTNHTDVGPNFPWEILASDIALLSHPVTPTPPSPSLPKDDDMTNKFIRNGDHPHDASDTKWNAFIVFSGGKFWIPTAESLAVAQHDYGPPVDVDDDYMRATGPVVGPNPSPSLDPWGCWTPLP